MSLDGVHAPATALGGAVAESSPGGIGEIRGESPTDVPAAGALARIEPLAALSLDRAEIPAAKALEGVFCVHVTLNGAPRRTDDPPRGHPQSVEYFGWTFSPRMRAIALFAAIAASPKPTEMSVILPS
jgi:hypothetical protein